MYEINKLLKKNSIFETKILLPLDSIIINRNIKLCKSYGFVEESEIYFKCIFFINAKTYN